MRFANYFIVLFLFFSAPAIPQDSAAVKKTADYTASGFDYRLRIKNYSPDIVSITKPVYKFIIAGIVTGKINQDMILVTHQPGYSYPCEFRTFFFSPTLSLDNNIFNLEAGPSFNFIGYYHRVYHLGPGAWEYDNKKYSNVGFLVKAAIRFPSKTTIFFKAEFQYLNAGLITPPIREVTFSQPYNRRYININEGNSVLYSWYAGAGMGVRFFKNAGHKLIDRLNDVNF